MRRGPWAPISMVCSMSAVREGPVTKFSARGGAGSARTPLERVLDVGDDVVRAHDDDVVLGQEVQRRGRLGAAREGDAAGLGHGREARRDARGLRPRRRARAPAPPPPVAPFGPVERVERGRDGDVAVEPFGVEPEPDRLGHVRVPLQPHDAHLHALHAAHELGGQVGADARQRVTAPRGEPLGDLGRPVVDRDAARAPSPRPSPAAMRARIASRADAVVPAPLIVGSPRRAA